MERTEFNFEIICLDEIELPDFIDSIDVKDNVILCSQCAEPADALHYSYESKKWMAGCPEHELGEYWIRVDDLALNLVKWILQLAEKNDDRLTKLILSLGHKGMTALEYISK